MKDIFNRLFQGRNRSKEDAKKRLKLLLVHDQVDLTPGQMEAMKQEIMVVIQKYVEVDMDATEIRLDRGEKQVALGVSVPVHRVVNRPVTVTA